MPTLRTTHAEAAVMLNDARDYIERVGWAKGTEKTPTGAVCLHRALLDVDGTKHGKDVDTEARRMVLHLAATSSIPVYNDDRRRTKQDVLDLLAAAVTIERELAE